MKRLKAYLKYIIADMDECLVLNQFRLYRMLRGGVWYRIESTGQLPGLYGGWWTRSEDYHKRYTARVKTESYH